MRRVRRVFLIVALAAIVVVASSLPAIAASYTNIPSPVPAIAAKPTDHLVFLPPGGNNRTDPKGDTFRCTGGPPFIFGDNCRFVRVGKPAKQVCNKPTIFTDNDAKPKNARAFICHKKKH